jgi:hypothetical protein
MTTAEWRFPAASDRRQAGVGGFAGACVKISDLQMIARAWMPNFRRRLIS